MAVVDSWGFAQRAAIVYNTSVADSLAVAMYYASERGIPAANLIGFAMGTTDTWAYDAGRFANLWTPLRNHLITIGAQCVLTAAGCPHKIEVKLNSDGVTNIGLYLPSLLAAAKRIYSFGGAVTCVDQGSGNRLAWNPTDNKPVFAPRPGINNDVWQTASDYAESYTDSRYQAAVASSGAALDPDRLFYRIRTSWRQTWDTQDTMPAGVIGWLTYPDTTHPVDLLARSKDVIRRGVQNELPIASARSQKILVGIRSLDSIYTPTASAALMVPELAARGFANVTYWYDSSASSDATSLLLAPSPAIWNNVTLDAGTVTPVNYWMGFGYAFANDKWATWNTQLVPTKGGTTAVGLSDSCHWLRQVQADGGIGGLGTPRDVAHATVQTGGIQYDVMCALLDGRSLAEAMMVTYPGRHVAIGDPLMRPVRT